MSVRHFSVDKRPLPKILLPELLFKLFDEHTMKQDIYRQWSIAKLRLIGYLQSTVKSQKTKIDIYRLSLAKKKKKQQKKTTLKWLYKVNRKRWLRHFGLLPDASDVFISTLNVSNLRFTCSTSIVQEWKSHSYACVFYIFTRLTITNPNWYTIFTLVNQKALVVAATLRSRLFNTLEWAKNGGKGKQKIYLLLL